MNPKHKSLAALLIAISLTGCLKSDSDRVKTASWDGEKPPPEGREVKNAPAPRISSSTHLASGRMLEQQNDISGAIRQYERAIQSNPKFVEAHNRLGICYQRLGRYADAEGAFKKGVHLAPDSAMLHNNLGYCYLLQEQFEAAEREFRAALVIAPAFDRARMNLAIVLASTDRILEAVEEFSQVVPAEVAYFNVAVLCTDRQQYSEAEDALRRALKINPRFQPARDHLDRIAEMATARRAPNEVHIRLAEELEQAGEDAFPPP